jgi:hypothetical protein
MAITVPPWTGNERKVVYTAVTAGRDSLQPPRAPAEDWAYVCFSDAELECPPWKVVRLDAGADSDPVLTARRLKVLAHQTLPRANVSLWVDGNMMHAVPPDDLVETYLRSADIAAHRHPRRTCTYEEAVAVLELEKDVPARIVPQMVRYAQRGFPPQAGLLATTALLRRHTEEIASFERRWWSEIEEGSRRDQLSVMFALAESGIEPAVFDSDLRSGPLFEWRHHDAPAGRDAPPASQSTT